MELNYTGLKKKKVVNIVDGRDLGKVTDIVFLWPEGKIIGFVVGKKSLFSDDELIINACCVNKIGDDAILVSLGEPKGQGQAATCMDEIIE